MPISKRSQREVTLAPRIARDNGDLSIRKRPTLLISKESTRSRDLNPRLPLSRVPKRQARWSSSTGWHFFAM